MAEHICPWWMGYLLASPLRRFLEKPEELVGPFLRKGMIVVDYGCGMGFFSLPIAKIVGPSGKVLAVDIQQKMLKNLKRRAHKADLYNIEPMNPDELTQVPEHSVDFVAAIHVVHEIPEPETFFYQMKRIMKKNAKLLIIEPKFHVTDKELVNSVQIARSVGFSPTQDHVPATRAQVLQL